MHGLDRVRSCGTGGESQFLQHDHLIPQWDGIKHAQETNRSPPEHQLAPAQRGPQHGQSGNRRQQTGGGGHGATRTSRGLRDVGLKDRKSFEGHPEGVSQDRGDQRTSERPTNLESQ